MSEDLVFEAALKRTLAFEGGYVNDPDDSGGETNMGITLKTARAHGYMGNMKDITLLEVRRIYKEIYWDKPKLGKIVGISPKLAEYLFDMGVNMGPIQAMKYLQQCISYLIPTPGLVYDGLLGPKTMSWLEGLSRAQRESLFALLVYKHIDHYIKITQINPKQIKFINGWLKRVGVR